MKFSSAALIASALTITYALPQGGNGWPQTDLGNNPFDERLPVVDDGTNWFVPDQGSGSHNNGISHTQPIAGQKTNEEIDQILEQAAKRQYLRRLRNWIIKRKQNVQERVRRTTNEAKIRLDGDDPVGAIKITGDDPTGPVGGQFGW